MNHDYGEQFDPADYTTKEIKERFPDDAEELLKIQKQSWADNPEYYRAVIEKEFKELGFQSRHKLYGGIKYVDEYDRDESEECKRCKGNCGYVGMGGFWVCNGFIPITNGDRIRRMSNKELAIWLSDTFHGNAPKGFGDSIDRWLSWLQEESPSD